MRALFTALFVAAAIVLVGDAARRRGCPMLDSLVADVRKRWKGQP